MALSWPLRVLRRVGGLCFSSSGGGAPRPAHINQHHDNGKWYHQDPNQLSTARGVREDTGEDAATSYDVGASPFLFSDSETVI